MTLKLTEKDGTVRFEVYAKPRAKKSRVVGPRGGALEVALAAPPVDGAANAELVRVLAKTLDVPRRAVHILRGETSQNKLISVELTAGADLEAILRRLTPQQP